MRGFLCMALVAAVQAVGLIGCTTSISSAANEKTAAAPTQTGNGTNNLIVVDGVSRSGATFTFRRVVIERDGWIVFHPFKNGAPSPTEVAGYAFVGAGAHEPAVITIDYAPEVGEKFVAMLHFDMNEDGVFDFNDGVTVPDAPVFEDGVLVAHRIAAPSDDGSGADALAELMTDTFQTAPDDPDNTIRDHRVRISSASFDGVWLYYQLNTGDDWKVYRQRVVELIDDGDGSVIQKTYGLKDPERFVDAWDKPGLLTSMTASDIEPYFDGGCEQRWRRSAEDEWRGYVDPATCKIFSERRQAHISIEAEARLSQETYRQTERGFDENGEKLFGTEPGEFIVLYRQ